ncbi:hypothetical protein CISIN_1g0478892mg, partial [Citrus sinensis]
CEEYLIKSRSS